MVEPAAEVIIPAIVAQSGGVYSFRGVMCDTAAAAHLAPRLRGL
jgi:hypothetical protein